MSAAFTSILVLGGARSGKSTFAEELAAVTDRDVTVVATAEAFDADMRERIDAHRTKRPSHWSTIEEPRAIAAAVAAVPTAHTVILDCLTVWLGTMFHDGRSSQDIMREIDDLVTVISSRSERTIVVSNEVGLGIVPATELGREYRDLLGRINSRLAAGVDRAVLMVAGRALDLMDARDLLT